MGRYSEAAAVYPPSPARRAAPAGTPSQAPELRSEHLWGEPPDYGVCWGSHSCRRPLSRPPEASVRSYCAVLRTVPGAQSRQAFAVVCVTNACSLCEPEGLSTSITVFQADSLPFLMAQVPSPGEDEHLTLLVLYGDKVQTGDAGTRQVPRPRLCGTPPPHSSGDLRAAHCCRTHANELRRRLSVASEKIHKTK